MYTLVILNSLNLAVACRSNCLLQFVGFSSSKSNTASYRKY